MLSDHVNNNNFAENKAKIKSFFEANHLKDSIAEFYQVQLKFHQDMVKLVAGFNNIHNKLPDNKRYLISELLEPYKVLTKNLFHKPTNDPVKDIIHIKDVLSKQNEKFVRAVAALQNSISNLSSLKEIIKDPSDGEQIVQSLKQALNCQSSLMIEFYIDTPFQNLIRYQNLLATIKKNLIECGVENIDHVLSHIQDALANVICEINTINENKDIIFFLNKIELILGNLLTEQRSKLKEDDKENKLLLEQIENLMYCIFNGRKKILEDDQDIEILYKAILELLKTIVEQYTIATASNSIIAVTSYVASAGYSLLTMPFTLFASTTQDKKPLSPLEQLKSIITSLEEELPRIAAVKAIINRHKTNLPQP